MPEEQLQRAVGGLLVGLVAVEDQDDAVGQAAEGRDVIVAQGGAQGPHHVREPDLVRGDHVGVPFDNSDPAFGPRERSGKIGPIENSAFEEQRRLWGIQILSDTQTAIGFVLFDRGQNPPSEAQGAPALIVNREDQPPPEPLVGDRVLLRSDDQADTLQGRRRDPRLASPGRQPVARLRRESQAEAGRRFGGDPPFLKIAPGLG